MEKLYDEEGLEYSFKNNHNASIFDAIIDPSDGSIMDGDDMQQKEAWGKCEKGESSVSYTGNEGTVKTTIYYKYLLAISSNKRQMLARVQVDLRAALDFVYRQTSVAEFVQSRYCKDLLRKIMTSHPKSQATKITNLFDDKQIIKMIELLEVVRNANLANSFLTLQIIDRVVRNDAYPTDIVLKLADLLAVFGSSMIDTYTQIFQPVTINKVTNSCLLVKVSLTCVLMNS